MKRNFSLLWCALVTLPLLACTSSDDGNANPSDASTDGRTSLTDGGLTQSCGKMDILFVVDSSDSMLQEQTNLTANIPKFFDAIDEFSNGSLDYRIAVTTADRDVSYLNGPGGAVQETGGNGVMRTGGGVDRQWIERGDATARMAFSTRAEVGTAGSVVEMPLLATKLALVDRIADSENGDFLRPDALLSIVILTDADDCSRTDNGFPIIEADQGCTPGDGEILSIESTLSTLDSVKGGNRSAWAAAVIAGISDCKSAFGSAEEAANLKSFVTMAGQNAVFSSICQGDLSAPIDEILQTFETACNNLIE